MKEKITNSLTKTLTPRDKAFEVADSEIKGFLLRVQPTGRKTCYFTYRTIARKRQRIKIGVLGSGLTVAQARDQALRLAAQVTAGIDVQGVKSTKRTNAQQLQQNTLSNFIEESYKPWALANLKSAELSIQSVQRAFKSSLNSPLVYFDVKTIENWRTDKLKSGIKPTTVNRLVNALRAILTKAVEWEVIPEHPLQKLKQLKIDEASKARFLHTEEETRLLNELSKRDKELIESRDRANEHRRKRGNDVLPSLSGFLYGDRMTPLIMLSLKTGLRRGELFDLDWEDIDFKNKVLTVHGENAKSSKTRHIPLSPTALEVLTEWQRQTKLVAGRVFPSDTGGRLNNVNTAWRNLLNKASIKSFRWHDMRHDFASKLVMKGVPLNTVRELCGHADLNTTLRYAHLAPDHRSNAIALLG